MTPVIFHVVQTLELCNRKVLENGFCIDADAVFITWRSSSSSLSAIFNTESRRPEHAVHMEGFSTDMWTETSGNFIWRWFALGKSMAGFFKFRGKWKKNICYSNKFLWKRSAKYKPLLVFVSLHNVLTNWVTNCVEKMLDLYFSNEKK